MVRLGVLLAIRFPKDYDGRLVEQVITNVNLFRYVFAALSGSDDILDSKEADDGYVWRKGHGAAKAVENGRALSEFVQYRP